MKQERNARMLFDAVSSVDHALIDEAATAPARSVSVILRRVIAAAAALALLVTGWLFWPVGEENTDGPPGVIKVYAYEQTGGSETDDLGRYEVTDVTAALWCKTVSSSRYSCLRISLEVVEQEYKNEEISFDVTVNNGNVFKTDNYGRTTEKGKTLTFESGEIIHWNNIDLNAPSGYDTENLDKIFMDVVVKADGYPVGYAVIRIIYERTSLVYYATLKERVCYFMEDGSFQPITEGEIMELIEQCHKSE